MSDDLVKRLRFGSLTTMGAGRLNLEAADRIEELEAKLAKKDGCLEETYRRWKNGADLRALAKAEGCTQERMRYKMKRYEDDKVRLLEAKLAKAAEALVQLVVEYDEVDLAYDEPTSMTSAVNVARLITAELKVDTDAPE